MYCLFFNSPRCSLIYMVLDAYENKTNCLKLHELTYYSIFSCDRIPIHRVITDRLTNQATLAKCKAVHGEIIRINPQMRLPIREIPNLKSASVNDILAIDTKNLLYGDLFK